MSNDHKTASFCAQQKEIFSLDLSDAKTVIAAATRLQTKTPKLSQNWAWKKRTHSKSVN